MPAIESNVVFVIKKTSPNIYSNCSKILHRNLGRKFFFWSLSLVKNMMELQTM